MDTTEIWNVNRPRARPGSPERAGVAAARAVAYPDAVRRLEACAKLAAHLGYGPRAGYRDVLVQAVKAGGSFNRMVDANRRAAMARTPHRRT